MTEAMKSAAGLAAEELLEATLALARRALADPCWDHLRAALPDGSPPARREVVPRPLPVMAWLNGIEDRAAPDTRDLCAVLCRTAPQLAWGQTYGVDDFGAGFLERYGWTEVLGQRGPFVSDSIACGFLLLGPGVEYPRHRHEAEEIYLILSGTAEWLKDDHGFVPRPPGALIHTPPLCWHGIRTGDQALLVLYLWSAGDLTQKSEVRPIG